MSEISLDSVVDRKDKDIAKRILAIDYGDVRVGLAISDLTQTIAQPFKTLLYSDSNNLLNQLDNIIKENKLFGYNQKKKL